jgi:hypothetical protein
MSIPEVNSVLRNEVARLKEAHRTWHKRLIFSLGVCLLAGILIALATWYMQKPIDRDATMLGGVLALGVGVFFVGSMCVVILIRKPSLNCPQCGYDWKGSVPTDDWLTWSCCPGCGLTMSGDTRHHEKP